MKVYELITHLLTMPAGARKRNELIETGISSRLTLRGDAAHDEGLRANHASADHAGRGGG
jgi:hypothetical protein